MCVLGSGWFASLPPHSFVQALTGDSATPSRRTMPVTQGYRDLHAVQNPSAPDVTTSCESNSTPCSVLCHSEAITSFRSQEVGAYFTLCVARLGEGPESDHLFEIQTNKQNKTTKESYKRLRAHTTSSSVLFLLLGTVCCSATPFNHNRVADLARCGKELAFFIQLLLALPLHASWRNGDGLSGEGDGGSEPPRGLWGKKKSGHLPTSLSFFSQVRWSRLPPAWVSQW